MLATLRRMNHPPTKSTNPNHSTSGSSNGNDHQLAMKHFPKHLYVNASLGEEPNTPCILNTPNTCTKNVTFFPEITSNLQTPSITGKFVGEEKRWSCLFHHQSSESASFFEKNKNKKHFLKIKWKSFILKLIFTSINCLLSVRLRLSVFSHVVFLLTHLFLFSPHVNTKRSSSKLIFFFY